MDKVKQWTTEERLDYLESAVENIVKILGHYEKMHENAVVVGKTHNRVLQLIVNEIGIGDEIAFQEGEMDDATADVVNNAGTNRESEDDSA